MEGAIGGVKATPLVSDSDRLVVKGGARQDGSR